MCPVFKNRAFCICKGFITAVIHVILYEYKIMEKYRQDDIIAALATASGKSALSIVRMSGKGCLAVMRKCLVKEPDNIHPREANISGIKDDRGEFDQVVYIHYREPRSYTGEDMVEINCHGGDYISQRLLSLLCAKGARPAEPGEFTFRAFINGRIDLTQAEGVADIIAAESELANKNALLILNGGLLEKVKDIRQTLIRVDAEIEVELEFPEDEPMEADYWGWSERLKRAKNELDSLIYTGRKARAVREGFRVVIAGPPNSGKSTLLNALLGENRAIVNPKPGTTRDILKEKTEIGGLQVILSDTAGLRETTEEIESEGINRARKEIESANLVIYLYDISIGRREKDFNGRNVIFTANKADLYPGMDENNDLKISALRGDGLDKLKDEIKKHALQKTVEGSIVANERHLNKLLKTSDCVLHALEIANIEGETEMMALEIREGIRLLGEITGEGVTEEVLEEIFGRFCIGK